MKRYFSSLLILLLAGCSTTNELRQAAHCKVWKDNSVIGPQSMDVQNSSVIVKGRCLWLFWGCMESKTDIDTELNIFHKGQGVFSSRTKIATLRGTEVVYEKTFLDSMISVSPIQLDMAQKTAHRSVTVNALNKTADDTLEFNQSCTASEAAVGSIAFWINENKH